MTHLTPCAKMTPINFKTVISFRDFLTKLSTETSENTVFDALTKKMMYEKP